MRKVRDKIIEIFSRSRVALTLVLSLILVIFCMVNQVITLNKTHENNINERFERVEAQVNTIAYKAIKREASEKVKNVSIKLRAKLVEMYDGDFQEFIREYDESSDNSNLIKTLNEVLENEEERFFHVKNDENDIYIISPKEVLADKSRRTASKNDEDRPLNSEIHKYQNSKLAKQVYDNIIMGRRTDLFLQIPSDKQTIERLDIKDVLKMPIEDLECVEFLTVSYIDEYGDLASNQDVDRKGKENTCRKIILIQSFNLYDQVKELGMDKQYSIIRSSKDAMIYEQILERKIYAAIGTLTAALLIISFLVMAYLRNRYIRERDKCECKR